MQVSRGNPRSSLRPSPSIHSETGRLRGRPLRQLQSSAGPATGHYLLLLIDGQPAGAVPWSAAPAARQQRSTKRRMVQAAPTRGVDLRLLATFIAPIRTGIAVIDSRGNPQPSPSNASSGPRALELGGLAATPLRPRRWRARQRRRQRLPRPTDQPRPKRRRESQKSAGSCPRSGATPPGVRSHLPPLSLVSLLRLTP
jgi:hypothetical protein